MNFFAKIFGHVKKKQYFCTRFRRKAPLTPLNRVPKNMIWASGEWGPKKLCKRFWGGGRTAAALTRIRVLCRKHVLTMLNGVMVALQILVLSVWVRVLVEQHIGLTNVRRDG